MCYSNQEIATEDSHGRRLFLSCEFNEKSGTHKYDPAIHIGNVGRLKGITAKNKTKVIDSQVFRKDTNIALLKSDFADYVCNDIEPFSAFKFQGFLGIFETIKEIIEVACPKVSICLPNLQKFFNDIDVEMPSSQRLVDVFGLVASMLEMMMQLFIVSTIRSYEEAILKEVPRYKKKLRR